MATKKTSKTKKKAKVIGHEATCKMSSIKPDVSLTLPTLESARGFLKDIFTDKAAASKVLMVHMHPADIQHDGCGAIVHVFVEF
jgi:hypothetical protein